MISCTVLHKALVVGGRGELEADLGTATLLDVGIAYDSSIAREDLVEMFTTNFEDTVLTLRKLPGNSDTCARLEMRNFCATAGICK